MSLHDLHETTYEKVTYDHPDDATGERIPMSFYATRLFHRPAAHTSEQDVTVWLTRGGRLALDDRGDGMEFYDDFDELYRARGDVIDSAAGGDDAAVYAAMFSKVAKALGVAYETVLDI